MLHNLSVNFTKGRLAVILGPSGCGKSTLVDMVAGLNVPDEGQVLINDVPITAVDITRWRKQIGYVAQEMFLQNDTVRNNVLIGRTGISDAEVIHSLRCAGLKNELESGKLH